MDALTPTGPIGIANVGDYHPEQWPSYFKQVPTRAARVAGPFTVLVHDQPDGEISCADGYVAIDARGYPYPIAADEFDLIYGTDRKLDHASLPLTTLSEITTAHSFGLLGKDEASAATRKLLVANGLLGETERP